MPRELGGTDELVPLMRPALKPFYDMVECHKVAGQTITDQDMLMAVEQVVELQCADSVGLYLRVTPGGGPFYFGKAIDQTIAKRSSGHTNSTTCLNIAWPVATEADIGAIEREVHRKLSELGAQQFREHRGTKGLYKQLPSHMDPAEAVRRIMRDNYESFYHGVISFETAYGTPPELQGLLF